jgi:hypothetical protein
MSTVIKQSNTGAHSTAQQIVQTKQEVIELRKKFNDLVSAHNNLLTAHCKMRAAIIRMFNTTEYSDTEWPAALLL